MASAGASVLSAMQRKAKWVWDAAWMGMRSVGMPSGFGFAAGAVGFVFSCAFSRVQRRVARAMRSAARMVLVFLLEFFSGGPLGSRCLGR